MAAKKTPIELNGYLITRTWFEFCANNLYTLNITSNHTAVFLYISNVWNITGQPKVFGIPTGHSALFLKISTKTYYKVIDDLVEWNFLIINSKGKNKTTAPTFHYGNVFHSKVDSKFHSELHSKVVSEVDSKSHLIEPKNIEPINKEIDTNVSIKKGEAKESSKHNFSKSPFYELSAFEQEFIRLGDIKMPDKKIKPTEIDIEYYWNSAMDYGVDISHKYANWVIAVRSWIKNAPQRNKQIIYKKVEQFKEIYSNLPPPPKIETKTAEQIHEEAMRHINGYDN